jgi:dextranase
MRLLEFWLQSGWLPPSGFSAQLLPAGATTPQKPTVSLDADKAAYKPGDTVTITAATTGATGFTLVVKYFSLNKVLATQKVPVEKDGSTTITWQPPATDYTGYLAQANLLNGKTNVASAALGIDVSSDWGVYPRYGF